MKGGKKMLFYSPRGPYATKSYYFEKEYLELVMFYDYRRIYYYSKNLDKSDQSEDELLKFHIDWLLERGENRKPKLVCPTCKEKLVKFFGVIYNNCSCMGSDFEVGKTLTTCGRSNCFRKLKEIYYNNYIELRIPLFSEILQLSILPEDQKKLGDLYKIIFGLPDKLSYKEAFNFFISEN